MSSASDENRATRVLIIDDHPIVRDGLRMLLEIEEDIEVCGEADSVAQAAKMIEKLRPNVALVDLYLGTSNGLDIIRYAHTTWVGVKTIVVSMAAAEGCVKRAIKAGAMAFVSKHEASEHILEAIRCVCQGGTYLSPSVTAEKSYS